MRIPFRPTFASTIRRATFAEATATRRAGTTAVLLALAVTLACSSAKPTGDVEKIQVEHSQLSVTVRNTAGLALHGLQVEIVPSNGTAPYGLSIARLENSDSREFSLSSFHDINGSSFSMRLTTPRSVTVEGKDMNGRTVKVEVPWQ